ncbi:hypothetical protein MMYC01_206934 [Madurella mycetomatis]|uniref:Uncharacterized protein n=1 Tax=Madurella mycetomatis TaxID=100816 RepID=A0A175VSJ5_9PEZI|nr:hypothetical protein MMYC01_208289 [Madurella mycetomatis]KXX76289.1 hypothetical protein MMYC01_206934 [Madurella mycetomatis]
MHSLRLSSCLAALTAFSVNAALPDSDAYALLLSRQAPGTPLFECHENCGNTISLGRTPEPCDNDDWVSAYEACLECALEFDIWRLYGNGVTSVAETCGLSPTPVPASSSTPTSTSASASNSASASDSASDSVAPTDTSAATTGASDTTTETPSTATDAPSSINDHWGRAKVRDPGGSAVA